ncbi:MAG TPA: hypothetical protein VNA13_03890 [Xanthomonadales bacterium]|nr:hypothetical protein [Xanthomonadales bacterium]
MQKKIRKHKKPLLILTPIKPDEKLHEQIGRVPLNKAFTDRISFSVLRNKKNNIRKIQNVSYEILIDEQWEWVVRFDDHGGNGELHRHRRLSLIDEKIIEDNARIKKYKNKDGELTWICNKDIKKNYMAYRSKFLKNSGLDLY